METPSRPAEPTEASPPDQQAARKSERAAARPISDRPRGVESSQHMLAALSASSRAEASLSTLMRAIRDLSSGVSGAREANVQLLRELEGMSNLLGSSNERQLALKNRVTLLEQQLERSHAEAQAEREYILEQQDAFIAAMMEDHEQVIAELNKELEALRGRASQRPSSPELPSLAVAERTADLLGELDAAQGTVQKLLGERDRARETLLKLQAQRDEAQATVVALTRELEAVRNGHGQARITDAVRQVIPATTTPPPGLRSNATLPPPEPLRASNNTPPGPPVEERTARASSPSRPRAPNLELTPREVPSHPSPPPEELRLALHPPSGSMPAFPAVTSAAPASAPRTERAFEKRSLTPPGPPVLTASAPPSNPEPTSLRPGGGYSLTNSVAPEHVSPSRAPRR